ncbi:MAG: hypothetical protein KAG98_00735 [Lentisphaeria bacterium]|nr:hypothetical protein [Lentisphaeria bacterium]
MRKNMVLAVVAMCILSSCDKPEVKSSKKPTQHKQLLGAPEDIKIDKRGKLAEDFVRLTEKDIGKVIRYRRQVVAGVNHFFEFSKDGKMPMEIIVFEDLKGTYKITSKSYLE